MKQNNFRKSFCWHDYSVGANYPIFNAYYKQYKVVVFLHPEKEGSIV